MPAHDSHRFPRDLDLAMRVFQVDGSWYENYWLKERKPRSAGLVARNLPTIVSCLRLACDRLAWVRRAVLAIVLGPKMSAGVDDSPWHKAADQERDVLDLMAFGVPAAATMKAAPMPAVPGSVGAHDGNEDDAASRPKAVGSP
jgi:hypothetical protein